MELVLFNFTLKKWYVRYDICSLLPPDTGLVCGCKLFLTGCLLPLDVG